MTKLLYLKDSYIRSFTAEVVGSEEGAVFLDSTAFYPAGGGQPSDMGTLSSVEKFWSVGKV
ncbi:MAG: alanine--tRNA ligase-related protein, partial [Candidatus Promineifilaceae bacterium]